MNAVTTTQASSMIPTDMGAAMRLAEMMATGKLVPSHLQKSPGDCLMVIELAMRFKMSPFAVAQCTSVIQGKLMLEGKLVAAAINSSGILARRLNYDFSGVNDTRAVTVRGTLHGETTPREMTVALKEAATTNPLWKRQPDQQLVYFATRAWARRHAPEVMLGVYAPEEFDRDTLMGLTLDGEAIAPEATPEPPPKPKTAAPDLILTRPASPDRQTAWLDKLELELANAIAAGPAAVDAILARADVQAAQDRARNGHKDRLDGMLQDAIQRSNAAETSAPNDSLYANPDEDPFREYEINNGRETSEHGRG